MRPVQTAWSCSFALAKKLCENRMLLVDLKGGARPQEKKNCQQYLNNICHLSSARLERLIVDQEVMSSNLIGGIPKHYNLRL